MTFLSIPFFAFGLGGCKEAPKNYIPNLGAVQTTLYRDGKAIQVYAVDDDLDRDVDRVFGDGYLMFYDAELPDSSICKEGYDPLKSKPLSKTDERILSQKLEQNNLTEYLKSLERKF